MNSPSTPDDSSSQTIAQRENESHVSVEAHWSGPLPPPSALAAYEAAVPGSAERILAMAEAELSHSHDIERVQVKNETALIEAEIASERRGVWLAFFLAILVIGLSAFLMQSGLIGVGLGLISVSLLSLVGIFVYGRNRSNRS